MGMQKFDPGVELAEGTNIVFAGPCGLGSMILVGDGTNAATMEIYDHASALSGSVIKKLALKAGAECIVYCPAKPDSLAKGCVAVVTCTAGVATGYVSISS